jgi:hypothetical protein
MPGPGEYTEGEQRFINYLGIFTIILVLLGMGRLLWACFHADFTNAVEYRQTHYPEETTKK